MIKISIMSFIYINIKIVLFLFIILFISCQNEMKNKIKKGSLILLKEKQVQIKAFNHNFNNNCNMIIYYFDASCSICYAKIKDLISKNINQTNETYFIYNTNDSILVFNYLKQFNIVDEGFYSENHISKDVLSVIPFNKPVIVDSNYNIYEY